MSYHPGGSSPQPAPHAGLHTPPPSPPIPFRPFVNSHSGMSNIQHPKVDVQLNIIAPRTRPQKRILSYHPLPTTTGHLGQEGSVRSFRGTRVDSPYPELSEMSRSPPLGQRVPRSSSASPSLDGFPVPSPAPLASDPVGAESSRRSNSQREDTPTLRDDFTVSEVPIDSMYAISESTSTGLKSARPTLRSVMSLPLLTQYAASRRVPTPRNHDNRKLPASENQPSLGSLARRLSSASVFSHSASTEDGSGSEGVPSSRPNPTRCHLALPQTSQGSRSRLPPDPPVDHTQLRPETHATTAGSWFRSFRKSKASAVPLIVIHECQETALNAQSASIFPPGTPESSADAFDPADHSQSSSLSHTLLGSESSPAEPPAEKNRSKPIKRSKSYSDLLQAKNLFGSLRRPSNHSEANLLVSTSVDKEASFSPTTPVTKKQLYKASTLEVISTERDGQSGEFKRVQFGKLFEDKKTIFCFIRHFWCRLCQDYVSSILEYIPDPAVLDRSNMQLVIIGCGSPSMAKGYREKVFQLPYALYTDPTLSLHRALGMTLRTLDPGPDEERGDYVSHGTLVGTALVLKRALIDGGGIGKAGDMKQLGGELVLGPGLRPGYTHRMTNTRSHTPIQQLLAYADVDMSPLPSECLSFFEFDDGKAGSPENESTRKLSRRRRERRSLDSPERMCGEDFCEV